MAVSSAEFYEVRWRVKDADEAWSPPRRIAPTGEIVITELDRTQQYEFEVRAVSNCGAKSIWVSSDYVVPTVPALPQVPIPTGSGMADGVQLSWGDGGATRGDLQYEVQRSPAIGPYIITPPPAGDPLWTRVAIVSGTTWVDAVTDTVNYWYRIRTVNYTGSVGDWAVIAGPVAAAISTPEFAATVDNTLAVINAAMSDLGTQAGTLRDDVDATLAQVQVLQGQVGDILQADEWVVESTYPQGDLVQYTGKLYRSLIADNIGHEPAGVTDAYWEYIGNYASLGEAVGATAANVAVNTNKIAQNADDITATSQNLATVAATVTGQGNTLTAQGTRITQAEAQIAADGTAINAVASDMALLGAHNGDKSAFVLNAGTAKVSPTQTLAQYMSGVQAANNTVNGRVDNEQAARIAGDSANASSLIAVQARLADAGNLVSKSTFDDGQIGGWNGSCYVQGVGPADWSGHTQMLFVTAFSTDSVRTPAHAGDVFDLSGLCGVGDLGVGGAAAIGLVGIDDLNNPYFLGGFAIPQLGYGARYSGRVVIPAGRINAVYPYIQVVSYTGAILVCSELSLRRVTAAEKQNASAISSLTANVGPGGAFAQATTMLDVNNRISGVRQTNDGTTSDFIILADKFGIESPGGGARTEYSNGNWRVYDAAGTLRVQMGIW